MRSGISTDFPDFQDKFGPVVSQVVGTILVHSRWCVIALHAHLKIIGIIKVKDVRMVFGQGPPLLAYWEDGIQMYTSHSAIPIRPINQPVGHS